MTTLGRWSVLLTLAVSLGAQLSHPRTTQAQQRAKPRASTAPLGGYAQSRLARSPGIPRAPTAAVTESEPNDSAALADTAALGDTVSANVDPTGDFDWYVFNVATDTIVVLDVDASQLGSPLDPVLWLVAPDGNTVLSFSDDFDGLDSYIEYHISAPGQYYAVVAGYDGGGGPGQYYYLKLSGFAPPPPPTPGPGDPTTLFATGLDLPYGVAAGPAGEFYVTDVSGQQLLRVSSGGVVSPFVPFGTSTPIKVALDGFGDLLVTYADSGFVQGGVSRVTLAGQVSTFKTGLGPAGAITVGPDGDVWVIDVGWNVLYRFDALGARKDSIDLSSVSGFGYTADLAFSPAGVLYVSNGTDAIYRIVNRVPVLAIAEPPYLESIAFDRDGYLYVANGYLGKVLLYDPNNQIVNDPFARSNLGGPIYLAFGRAADGAMTSRLFASNYGYNLQYPYIGSIVEMNPAAMRAPGFRVGVDLLSISTASVPGGVMGADYSTTLQVASPPGTPSWNVASGALPPGLSLNGSTGTISGVPEAVGTFPFVARVSAGGRVGFRSFTITVVAATVSIADAANHLLEAIQLGPDLLRFLDLQGNRNGHYDIGDFRAYLRSQGQLPAAAVAAAKERP